MLPSMSQKGVVDIVDFGEGEAMEQDYRRRRRSGDVIGHEGGDGNASKSFGTRGGHAFDAFSSI